MTNERPLTRWQRFRLVVKVVELRLRFILLLSATGLVFAYWDTIWNRYDKWVRPSTSAHASLSGIEHFCPMHPQVVQDQPGTCPICGMPLARRKKGEKAALPEGVLSRVQLAPFRMAQAGVKIAEVSYTPLTQTVSTVGYVAFDERRLAQIASKAPGKTRVEKLYANYTGMDVKAGEPLAELYSPELSQAIHELILAADRSSAPARSTAAAALLGDRQEMVRLAAEKLKRWGITQRQIDEIARTRKTNYTIPVLSPISGHVFKKNVVEGQELAEGFTMFEVADLSKVWVQAEIYERQIDLIRVGQTVEAAVDALSGRTFSGKVEFVQPHLDPATRTVEVRYSLDNPDHKLRPGMFATVSLTTPVAELPQFQARVLSAQPSNRTTYPASLTAAEQKTCPVTHATLGSMGAPVAVDVDKRKIWTCCDACPPKVTAQPAKYLALLAPVPLPPHEVLSVPESAVIDTGTRTIVYVESQPGVFEGRQVSLGPRTGNRFPVLDGLALGDKVAADGAFLIDAESRINPAHTSTGDTRAVAPGPTSPPAHNH